MGYTNYWNIKTADCEDAFNAAKKEMKMYMLWCLKEKKVILDIAKHIDPITEENALIIDFNGLGDEGCENFYLGDDLKQEVEEYTFCKTNRLEYDIVVLGCLFILKKHLGDAVTISCDGFQHRSIKGTRWDATEYTDDEVKDAYKWFKEFQAICPTGFRSGGILPLFHNK